MPVAGLGCQPLPGISLRNPTFPGHITPRSGKRLSDSKESEYKSQIKRLKADKKIVDERVTAEEEHVAELETQIKNLMTILHDHEKRMEDDKEKLAALEHRHLKHEDSITEVKADAHEQIKSDLLTLRQSAGMTAIVQVGANQNTLFTIVVVVVVVVVVAVAVNVDF